MPTIKTIDFLEKVSKMREMQILYKKRTDSFSRQASIKAEKEVDDIINKYKQSKEPPAQTAGLF